MFTRAKAALVALVLVATALVGVTPASAAVSYIEGTDPARVVFDPTAISKIELNHPAGSPWLTFDYLNSETYRPANIKITLAGKKAVTINNVGLRLKGQASRYDPKFPMKVKFDAFVKGQNFLGLKRMTLNNMVQDPSFVHEATAYKLYRAAGVPAPRTGYSKVSVEGFYMGLYLNIESIDKVFAKRWYKSTGHIYSGPYNCDVIPNNTCYTASTGDAVRTDLNNAGDASLLHGAAWWTAINNVADMNRVIRLMATDIFMSNWDGYSDAVQNNHFAHFDQDSKLTIIPWGLDQTFTTDPNANLTWDASGPIFRGWSDHRSTLLDHCIEYTPCHSQLIKEGARISKLATSIKLVDFKTKVGAVINSIIANDGDIHANSVQNLVAEQSWIDQFIPMRQAVLEDFLATRSPLEVTLTRETTTRAGSPAMVTISNLWQTGVTASYQWLKDGTDIENAVVNLLRFHEAETAILFCATRDNVRHLHSSLTERGFAVVALSGEHSQNERNHALQALRDRRARVCVATDVAARGIDLPGLSLVIHVEVPRDAETLQHRSGRTGRAGKKGTAILLVPYPRRRRVEGMLRGARIAAEWLSPPTAEQIRAADNERLLAALLTPVEPTDSDRALAQQLLAERSAEDIALALVQAHRTRMPEPEELLAAEAPPGRAPREGFQDSAWFRINIGRRHNADPRWLLPLLCRRGHVSRSEIGAIRITTNETLFEVPSAIAARFLSAVRRTAESDDGVEIEPSSHKPEAASRTQPRHKSSDSDRNGPQARHPGKNLKHRKRIGKRTGSPQKQRRQD